MTLWTLLQAALLFINAVAVLNEDRFLNKYGWSPASLAAGQFGGRESSAGFKGQVVGFVAATAYLRVPLVVVNTLVILVKIIFG